MELRKPRARISRSESRGKVFSALGELLWYLAGSNNTDHITHYIPMYSGFDEDGFIFGGYGPRLRGQGSSNQLDSIIQLLRQRPASRRAVIQLFEKTDLEGEHKDIPCTCTLQFLVRQNRLDLIVYMRSNDVFMGLPHDIFCFTMIQELVARALNVELGSYIHMVGSLHLYEDKMDAARSFLNEGWFDTSEMPAMPRGDPMPELDILLSIESELRGGTDPLAIALPTNPYWADLARLLVAFELDPIDQSSELSSLRNEFNSDVFRVHIDDRIARRGGAR